MVANISPNACCEQLKQANETDLIDVRTPAEFRAVHASGARNVPLEEVGKAQLLPGRRTFVICQSGARAKQACEKLESAGCSDVHCVEGGTKAWEAAGLPVERGRQMLSLDRQVRIGAGTLVLVGVALSIAVHPWWIGLSAFVGAGLVFAGVTDTCGMAILLARMPWNR